MPRQPADELRLALPSDPAAVALASMGHSVSVTDPRQPDNPLVYVNAAFEHMTGYSAGEVVGRNCRFLQGSDTDPEAVAEIRRGLAAQQAATVTLLNYRKDGTPFWNEVAITPVPDELGELAYFVGVQTDVTPRVVAEAERDESLRREQQARADSELAQVRLAFLATASAHFDASLDVDALLDRLCRMTVSHLADTVAVDIARADGSLRRVRVLAREQGHDAAAEIVRRGGVPDAVASVVTTGEPLLAGTGGAAIATADPAAKDALAELGSASAMVVPLRARRRIVGTLTLLARQPDRYREHDLTLALEVGRRAGIAMDHAQTFAERDHVARVLQQSLLPPSLPEIPGVSVATRYNPAGGGMEVGGDFYDLFDTGRGYGLVIGDVCGRGPDAAALTGLARWTLRAAAMREHRPSGVLQLLHEALLREANEERFVTAAYAHLTLTPRGLNMDVAVGGHPSPLVVSRAGEIRTVGHPGSLLGAIDHLELADDSVQLGPGDSVVLVTDGVLEAAGPTGLFGDIRLSAVVRQTAALGADETAEAVLTAVLDHTGGRVADDMAIVVLTVD